MSATEQNTEHVQEYGLFAEERHQRILELLADDSRVLVNELSDRFGVSAATLRNDLRELEQKGKLRRTHGGAVALEPNVTERPAGDALIEQHGAKQAIGRAAAALVHDGDTLICDSGSTTLEFIRALGKKRGLTIITNDFMISTEAERTIPQSNIFFLGGTVRMGFHYTMGSTTVNALAHLSAPTAFLATSAFSFERGFTTHMPDLALFKRTLIEHSERRIMLMDSSKIGTFTTVNFAELSDVSTLIVDDGISEADRKRIEEAEDAPNLLIADSL